MLLVGSIVRSRLVLGRESALLAEPVTAHALASAAYRIGIVQSSQAIRNDLAQATKLRHPYVEENHG